MLSYQLYEMLSLFANQESAILSLGWQPPPSPMPPFRYLLLIILLVQKDRACVTSSTFVFGNLWQVSIMVLIIEIFVEIYFVNRNQQG